MLIIPNHSPHGILEGIAGNCEDAVSVISAYCGSFEHSGGIRPPDTTDPSSTNHECALANTSCIWYIYYSIAASAATEASAEGDTLAAFSNKQSNPSTLALDKNTKFLYR
ncbi:hypothetical protein V6N13_129950 [Hibiscus sabdariffa]